MCMFELEASTYYSQNVLLRHILTDLQKLL